MAAFFLSSRTTLPLSITSRNPRHCPYDAASLPRPVCSRCGPPPAELSAHLLGLRTYIPLFWACWLPGTRSAIQTSQWGLLYVSVPPPCLALGCFLLASLLHQSWAVLHHLSTPPKKNSSNSHGCCIPIHIVLLSSFSAAEHNKKCKRPGRSQLKKVLADGATSTLCWQ